ncbi:unnamed protein product [Protopolystoma xenopodis]|uniref:PDZ domain-containing protein n=1 Tax=Protopolystoma xenopodis TaxID=117903 RepID=A0A448XFF0_9PLAT|nr:unnamed protein product [Protopolystoma xenopodis]
MSYSCSSGIAYSTIVNHLTCKNGRLRVGDRLVYIGEVNVRGLGPEQVASILRQAVAASLAIAGDLLATESECHKPAWLACLPRGPQEDPHVVDTGRCSCQLTYSMHCTEEEDNISTSTSSGMRPQFNLESRHLASKGAKFDHYETLGGFAITGCQGNKRTSLVDSDYTRVEDCCEPESGRCGDEIESCQGIDASRSEGDVPISVNLRQLEAYNSGAFLFTV